MSDLSTKPAGEPTAGDWWALSQQDRDMIDSIHSPRNPYAPYDKPGCLQLIVITALLVLAVLVAGCQQVCDCGWLTGPPYCEADMAQAMTWAYLPDWQDVAEWTVNVMDQVVTCYDENGEPVQRQVCGVDNITAVLKDDWVFVNVDLTLCAPPAPTATPGG